jgi:zinc protease
MFYWPNNATAILVGDVDVPVALAMVQKYYGKYPQSPHPIPQIYTQEPEQTGPRRVTVKMPGELGTVIIAHKVPNGRDPDTAPLTVLDLILSDGKNSRLYKALVDTNMATDAGAMDTTNFDLSLHILLAGLTPGSRHEAAEAALLNEVERVKKDGVTAEEVTSAIRRYRAQLAFGRDGTSATAFALNEAVATGDWTLYVSMEESINRVTAADVQRVARKYLNEDQSTTGWYLPAKPPAGDSPTPSKS